MRSLVTVDPVIIAFHSCCLSHHVFDQVTLWPAWVGIETAISWQCSPRTVASQRLYPLCHGPRRAIKVGYKFVLYLFRFCLDCSPFYVLSDGKVVFFPFIILCKFSRLTFCSCICVCSVLFGCVFGCVLLGCLAFLFSDVAGSFRLNFLK